MTVSTRLIVLNTVRTGESAMVLHTISPTFGRRSFIANIGKKTSMSLFLPLNVLDVEVLENPKSDLWRVRNIKALFPLSGIRGNIYKNTMTLFMSEVLFRVLKDGAWEDGLYEWCERNILTLDALEGDFSNYHIRFLMELASVLGFTPSIQNLAPFAENHYGRLKTLLECDFPSFMLEPMSGEERNSLASIMLKYISYHADTPVNVKSLPVLRELFR